MEEKSFIEELKNIKVEDINSKENSSEKTQKNVLNTNEILDEAKDKILNLNEVNENDYIKYSDIDKIAFIERELVKSIKDVDMNLESINIYEKKVKIKGFPSHIYETKNSFIETKRKILKELFDIIAHKQKLDKDSKGENFTEIIKS